MEKKKLNKKKKKPNNEVEITSVNVFDPVIISIQKGDLDSLQKLFIDVNFNSSKSWLEGYYLLQTAIKYGHIHIASWLISKNCKINRIDDNDLSDTPLHLAVLKNNFTIVKSLLEKDANKTAKNFKEENPLHISCQSTSIAITKLLLDHNTPFNTPDVHFSTPLHIAVEKESPVIVQLLLNRNVNINAYTMKPSYEGFTPLHIAVLKKNYEIIKILLKNKADVNAPVLFESNSINFQKFPFMKLKGYTPVHLAIEIGDAGIVKLILDNYSNNLKINFEGLTLLHIAIEKENLEIIQILLNYKMNINFYSKIDYHKGKTPLHIAISKQNSKLVELLLENGADIDAPINLIQALNGPQKKFSNLSDEGLTPLHLAVKMTNVDIVNLLLSYYPDILKADAKGFTPLHMAIEKECLKIVEILIKYKIQMNLHDNKDYCRGLTPLHVATIKKNTKIVEALLNSNVYVNEPIGICHVNSSLDFALIPYIKYKDYTALHVAVEINDYKMVQLLLCNGANIDSFIAENGLTPLHLSIQLKNKEIFHLLLQNQANFKLKTKDGKNILHLAVEHDWLDLVAEFLSKGISVNDKTNNGETLLYIAVEMGEEDLTELLIKFNADVNIPDLRKQSPLHVAAEYSVDMVRILLNRGAYVDAVNFRSETPLCVSVKNNKPEIVAEFLKFKPNIHDISNKYAFSFAIKNCQNYMKIVDLLFHYGFEIKAEDIEGTNLLSISFSEGYIDLAEYLSDHCFDKQKNNLLHKAVCDQNFEMTKLLIKNKYNLNLTDNFGKTPVDYAIDRSNETILNLLVSNGAKTSSILSNFLTASKINNESLCKLLIKCGADINAHDEFGTSALHFACWHKNIEFVKFLLSNNAIVNTTENFVEPENDIKSKDEKINFSNNSDYTKEFKRRMLTSPLHIAIIKRRMDVCDTLIKFNANINSIDGYRRTPLHLAAAIKFYNQEKLIKELINCGANINALDEFKKLPIHYGFNPICICSVAFQNEYKLYSECECNLEDDDDNKIISYFVKYIVLQICMNKYVHSNNLKVISGYSFSENLRFSCLSEINKMKEEKIGNHVTVYDILCEKSVSYAKNENVINLIQSNIFADKFPLYHEIVKENFINLQLKEEVLKFAIVSLNNLVSHKLPEDVSLKILESLNLNNLNNLVEAGKLYKSNLFVKNTCHERKRKKKN